MYLLAYSLLSAMYLVSKLLSVMSKNTAQHQPLPNYNQHAIFFSCLWWGWSFPTTTAACPWRKLWGNLVCHNYFIGLVALMIFLGLWTSPKCFHVTGWRYIFWLYPEIRWTGKVNTSGLIIKCSQKQSSKLMLQESTLSAVLITYYAI